MLIILSILFLSVCYGTVINVPANSTTIQAGINGAQAGDTVLVAAGTYYENIVWIATNGIILIGSGENDCIIYGDSLASVIRFEEDLGGIIDTTTLITGFTIQNGYAHGDTPNTYGGGMFLYDASPTLTNLTFFSNSARSGGGMYLDSSNPTLTGVTFSNNTANYGGGMYLVSSSPTLRDVTFTGNTANYNGGGMFLGNSSPTLTDVTFSDNTAEDFGGGMFLGNSSPTLTDVTFSDNTAEDFGGGMYLYSSSSTLTGVTFSGNSAMYGGGMNINSSSSTLIDVTFHSNTAKVSGGGLQARYSNIQITRSDFLFNSVYSTTKSTYGGGLNYFNYSNTGNNSFQISIRNSNFNYNNVSSTPINEYAVGGGVSIGEYDDNSRISLQIVGCSFEHNSAESYGGIHISGEYIDFVIDSTKVMYNEALYYSSAGGFDNGCLGSVSSSIISNNMITENNSPTSSALGVLDGANVDFINSTFANNITFNAGALSILAEGTSSTTNCIFWGNIPYQIVLTSSGGLGGHFSATFSDIQDGIDSIIVTDALSILDYGFTNIQSDPLFCDSINGDFSLSENSPCIGTGQGSANIGAFDVGCDEPLDIEDIIIPNIYALSSYPNPFNPTTTISFSIPEFELTTITAYDILGRRLETLTNEVLSMGNYSIKWNASSYPSGAYLIRMESGDFTQTQKVVLVK